MVCALGCGPVYIYEYARTRISPASHFFQTAKGCVEAADSKGSPPHRAGKKSALAPDTQPNIGTTPVSIYMRLMMDVARNCHAFRTFKVACRKFVLRVFPGEALCSIFWFLLFLLILEFSLGFFRVCPCLRSIFMSHELKLFDYIFENVFIN